LSLCMSDKFEKLDFRHTNNKFCKEMKKTDPIIMAFTYYKMCADLSNNKCDHSRLNSMTT
jgi:hypothetical protein